MVVTVRIQKLTELFGQGNAPAADGTGSGGGTDGDSLQQHVHKAKIIGRGGAGIPEAEQIAPVPAVHQDRGEEAPEGRAVHAEGLCFFIGELRKELLLLILGNGLLLIEGVPEGDSQRPLRGHIDKMEILVQKSDGALKDLVAC